MEIKVEVIVGKYANTYLVGTKEEVIIIDPAVSFKSLFQMKQKFFPEAAFCGIFLTHGHYDHFVNLGEILKEIDLPVYLEKMAVPKINNLELSCANLFGINYLPEIAFKPVIVHDLSKITLQTFEIITYKTPGHTNCSVCYLIGNNLFSGDTLFDDGVGRTDLPTGNSILLIKSLQFLLEGLEKTHKNCLVYPGHGNPTTLQKEKTENYFYQRCIKH